MHAVAAGAVELAHAAVCGDSGNAGSRHEKHAAAADQASAQLWAIAGMFCILVGGAIGEGCLFQLNVNPGSR